MQRHNIQSVAKYFFRQRNQVIVVRRENDLHFSRKLTQDLQSGRSPPVIEVDEEVIRNQRHVEPLVDLQFQRSQTKRQVKLVSRPLAHPGNVDLLATRANAEQSRCRFFGSRPAGG